MAFTYYTGVQIGKISDWDSVNNPDELTNGSDAAKGIGAVRSIFFVGNDVPATEAVRLQHMRDAGIKHIIETLHPVGNAPWNVLMSDWQTRVTNVVNGLKGHVDAWSIGNEPSAPDAGAVGGSYWPRFRAAANICHSLDPGTPVVLAAPFFGGGIQAFYNNANTDFNNNGLDIRDYADAWDIHAYYATPAALLNGLQANRSLVDGYAKSWSQMPMYITEFGWTVYNPKFPANAVPPGDTAGSSLNTQSGNMRVAFENIRDNHDIQANGGLRIRAAIWYIWQDISSLKDSGGGYHGAKKARFIESVNSPPAGVEPSPLATSPNGYRPAKTVLLSFFKVYDGAAVTPPVVTTVTPATSITTTSATLQGTVNPNGKATTRFFDWGPTASYGNTTSGVGVGSGSAVVNVSANLTGLVTGATYHYRCRATNSDGSDTGVDRTFTTLAPPLAPTVTAGGVTNVLTTTATIFGSVNPNGSAVTNYHFQYGLTTAYGGTTVAGTLPSGNSSVLVGANLTGLTAGQTYHYRLIATNSQGTTNGPDRSFVLTAPPTGTAPELARISVLSTLLSVEITTADSRSFRWDAENADVHNRPLSIQFATQQGDGFAEASCELPRPINLDWPDLHLLDRIRFIGADGSIAYEGRVAAMPRRIDSDGEVIEIQAQGLMATAKDRTFTEIYVDRLTDRWQEPSLAVRTMIMSNNWPLGADYTVDVGNGIHFKGITNKTVPAGSQAVVQYRAPSGVKLATLSYSGNEFNIGSIDAPTLYAADDDSLAWASWDANTLVLDGEANLRTPTITTPRTYFALRMNQTATGLVSPPPAHRRFNRIAVYGDHGVALRTNGTDPPGVYASDVMTDLIDRFCPLLNTDGVGTTQTLIAHLVFDTPTTPFDAFTLLNGYHLWQLGAWEDGKVIFEPADLTSTDWQVRSDDMGLTLELSGDASDQFANGMPVSYTDVDTREQILWPTDPDTGTVLYDDLVDDDPDNDANKWGIRLEPFILEVSNPVDQNGALTLGRVALAEFNRRKAPGSVTLTLGYIEDGQGNLQPGWKVRAGQTLAITDLPNDEPRLITGTSWTEDGALQITVEQPSTRVDAVLARLETSSQARGL